MTQGFGFQAKGFRARSRLAKLRAQVFGGFGLLRPNIGALIIRVGFGGILYYNYNKEPPKPYSNYYGPYSN